MPFCLCQLPLNSNHLPLHLCSSTLTHTGVLRSSSWVCSIASSNVTAKDISNWRVDSPDIFSNLTLHLDGEKIPNDTECEALSGAGWSCRVELNGSVTQKWCIWFNDYLECVSSPSSNLNKLYRVAKEWPQFFVAHTGGLVQLCFATLQLKPCLRLNN